MLRKLRLRQKNGFLKKKRLLVFILSLSQEKLVTKFFKKLKKKNYFGAILGRFLVKFQLKCFGEKGLCQFLNVSTIYIGAKIQKKLMTHS